METENLIKSLAAKNRPVAELPPPLKRFAQWIVAAIFCLGAGVAMFGVRHDVETILIQPALVIQLIFTLLLALSSSLSAFYLSVPDQNRPLLSIVPIVCALLWIIAIGYSLVTAQSIVGGIGLNCIRDIVVLGLFPGALLFLMIKKAAPLGGGKVGAFAALSVAALGAVGTQFICTNDDPLHILIWHYVPVLLLGWLGVILGRRLLKWTSSK